MSIGVRENNFTSTFIMSPTVHHAISSYTFSPLTPCGFLKYGIVKSYT